MKFIAVGSLNPIKIKAVHLGFTKIFPRETWQVIGYMVPSEVSAQPMSTAEAIRGARNRAKFALKQNPNASYSVGLEGGLEQVGKDWFDCGWIVVLDHEGKAGIASTARIHTPESIMRHIREGKELGDVMDNVFNRTNSKQAEGQFGLLTGGAVTRTAGYTDAVCLALSRFLHPKLFE